MSDLNVLISWLICNDIHNRYRKILVKDIGVIYLTVIYMSRDLEYEHLFVSFTLHQYM